LFFVKGGKPYHKPSYLGIDNSLAAVFINYLGPNGRSVEQTGRYAKDIAGSSSPQTVTRITNLSSVSQNILSQVLTRNLGLALLKEPLRAADPFGQNPSSVQKPTLNLTTVLPIVNSTSSKSPLLTQWLFEHAFVQRRDIVAKGAILVLSRVPEYKMDTVAPVNADRYRGNVYTKLGLQFRKPAGALTQQPSSLVNVSTHLGHFNFMSRISSNTRRPLIKETKADESSWGALSFRDESYLIRQNPFAIELSMLKYSDQIKRSYKKMVLSTAPLNSEALVAFEKVSKKPVFKLSLFNSLFLHTGSTKLVKGRKSRKSKSATTLRGNPRLTIRYKRHTTTFAKRRSRLEKFT